MTSEIISEGKTVAIETKTTAVEGKNFVVETSVVASVTPIATVVTSTVTIVTPVVASVTSGVAIERAEPFIVTPPRISEAPEFTSGAPVTTNETTMAAGEMTDDMAA